jgi:hypothetical protein
MAMEKGPEARHSVWPIASAYTRACRVSGQTLLSGCQNKIPIDAFFLNIEHQTYNIE